MTPSPSCFPGHGRDATNAERVAHREAVDKLVAEGIAKETVEHWKIVLEEARVPYGPVNTLEQVFEDPHVQAREMVRHVDHPTIGSVPLLAPPVRFNGKQSEIRMPPPLLGQHTDEILCSVLQLSPEEIESLRADGAIGKL